MELIKSGQLDVRGKSRLPNTIVFPRELRDAIDPAHNSRALEFDGVEGTTNDWPVAVQGLAGADALRSPRAQARLLVHESGKLNGKFTIWMDLDAPTMRALGQFLVDLANRAEK